MKSLEKLLNRTTVGFENWPTTDAEIDQLLLESIECSTAMENHDDRVASVLDRIEDRKFKRGFFVVGSEQQQCLFDLDIDCQSESQESKQSQHDYSGIVREAYLEVFDGYSTDRVVADPDRSCLFVQACWKRGAQASQSFLNRQLLNARKANKIGKIDGVKAYRVPRSQMDNYLFASEVGLRLVQDIEYVKSGRRVSLDDILCDPKLGKAFVDATSSISPGFKPVDYRWAALSVRKAFNRKSAKNLEIKGPDFTQLGTRDRILPSKLPKGSGFFWLACDDLSFYIGHSESIRRQIEMLVESNFEDRLAEYQEESLFAPTPVSFSIARYEGYSASARDPVKSLLIEEYSPRMNARKVVA